MSAPLSSIRIPRWLPLVALILSLFLAGWCARNRIPWSDEGWFSSPAYNLAFHGYLGTTVLDPRLPGMTRIDRHTYWVMPLFLVGQGLWYKVFPHTLAGTRAFSVMWVPLAALAFWAFLAQLFPRAAVSVLSCTLLLTSYIFIDSTAFGRPESMCLALGLCGLASFVTLRHRSLPLALLAANAFVAASGLTHPNGIFHFVALWACVFWFDGRRLNLLCMLAAACPYLVFGGFWSLYILQDKQAFLDQFAGNGANGGNGRLPTNWNPVSLVLSEIGDRYFHVFGLVTRGLSLIKLFVLFAYLGALGFCLLNRSLRSLPGVRLLLLLFLCYFGGMCVFNQKLSYYMIHILPIYIALLAVAICRLWEILPRQRHWIALAVCALVSIEISGVAIKAVTRNYIGPQREAIAYIDSHSRKDDRIFGSASLLYGMNFDPRLLDDPLLGVTSGRHPDVIVVEDLYKPLYDGWSLSRPQLMKMVRQRLSEYRLAASIAEYDIYLRPGR